VSWTIGITRLGRLAAIGGVGREDAVGERPEPAALGLVGDHGRSHRQPPEDDVRVGTEVVKPRGVALVAQLRGDDRHPL
jgi:hypothetical protein